MSSAEAYALWLASLTPVRPRKYMSASIAGNMRRLRIAEGLSLTVVARGLGLSSSFVIKIERGERTPSADRLCAIAEFFGVTPSELFETPAE